MKLEDFKPGDVLVVTSRSRQGEEERGAVVLAVNWQGNGYVSIAGHPVANLLQTGAGAFRPEQVGTTPYGLTVAVRKVGFTHVGISRPWTPKPGDRGYDLCHDEPAWRRRG